MLESNVDEHLNRLSKLAWEVRDNAYIIGKTKVGAAALSIDNEIFTGCNIEHVFRSHDIHAEVNAISNMVSKGHVKLKAILVVADRENFNPCGSCMDWIMQFGGDECLIAIQNGKNAKILIRKAKELMPYYPKK